MLLTATRTIAACDGGMVDPLPADASTADAGVFMPPDALVVKSPDGLMPIDPGSPPRAFVLETADPNTRRLGAAAALLRAEFDVATLPLDRAPDGLRADIIVLGSFASQHPAYAAYMAAQSGALRRFVETGGILVQLTQDHMVEPAPPFLPAGVAVRRTDESFAELFVVDRAHPLVVGLAEPGREDAFIVQPPHILAPDDALTTIWNGFASIDGFHTVLAYGRDGERPALIEAQIGSGRLLLGSLHWDKLDSDPPSAFAVPAQKTRLSQAFFANLRLYVAAHRVGALPPAPATPAWATPAIAPFVPGSTTVVVLPDTQYYSLAFPDILRRQTRWIADSKDARRIAYVFHVGDVVDLNSGPEWAIASEAFLPLDGLVPYLLVGGNHDYGNSGFADNRNTGLNVWFPRTRFTSWPSFGGGFESARVDNTYHLFDINGQPWIAIGLEFDPRDQALAWADGILAQHPSRRAFIVTHAYMFNDETRYDGRARPDQLWAPHTYPTANQPGGSNDGEAIWNDLVARHENVRFVLSGHVLGDGTARLSSRTREGRMVHQLLSNYQNRENGGNGWLRALEFHPDGVTVQVRSYSPWLNQHLTDSQNQFVLAVDP
jgi:3',5'-cyclic AMP phosphodiesterase CpdA